MSETNENIESSEQETVNDGASQHVEKSGPSPYENAERDELLSLLDEKDAQIGELNKDVMEAKDARLRKVAELDNYRKRVQRERSMIYETAKANALEDFLSISDDLTRTLKASNELEVDQTFLEGVSLVANKFDEVLKKHGVERIDQEMVPFNVDEHDALMRQKPEDSSVGSDMVLKVIENGYRIGDRIIRHAKVIVSE